MEEDSLIVKISPEISELSEIKTNLRCTEEGCTSVFLNTSNLEMHLIKTHKKQSGYLDKKSRGIVFQYFCPSDNCKYKLDPERKTGELRWFTKFRYLKQHYMNVHKEKGFECSHCKKQFLLQKDLTEHTQFECGKTFSCIFCPSVYTSYASLKLHCKRKNHSIDSSISRPQKCVKNNKKEIPLILNGGMRPILPKPHSDSSVNIAAAALSELSRKVIVKGVDKAIQTHNKKKASIKSVKKRASRETQTGDKHPRISAETQTTGLYSNKKSCKSISREKSMQTQTYLSASPKCQYPLNDIVLPQLWSSRNSSSTQTNSDVNQIVLDVGKNLNLDLFSVNSNSFNQFEKTGDNSLNNIHHSPGLSGVEDNSEIFSNDQIDRLIQQSTIFDETRSCNIETQTEIDFNDTFMEDCPLLSNTETQTIQNAIMQIYSNNCTQTCDEIFLNEFVEFSDIETQTAWANLSMELVSAETQTAL
ncbi:hypothetical protein AAG570_013585 [Ranatra chinensis]|uniref:C2H2-type domain-containing protein n=1 Tax=Ranatra chinensis TaxID=642074 RepID=A0ABD0YYZ8_9HEMI